MKKFAMISAVLLFSGMVYANIYTVTNINDSGAGSLREAIEQANASPVYDFIYFDIPGTGPHEIAVQSPLPDIPGEIFIDGFSQPGAIQPGTSTPAVLKIALNGAAAGAGTYGFSIGILCNVYGLAIYNFDTAINIVGISNRVQGCHIGLDVTGMVPIGNALDGIIVIGGYNLIGRVFPFERNVIAGNNNGIAVFPNSTNNRIFGNYVGTDATGNNTMANNGFDGIAIGSSNNQIIYNVVVGHESNNVLISWWFDGSPFPTGNEVTGNNIGHHANGSFSSFSNNCQGISINMASNTTVIDNTIYGNGCHGVLVDGNAANGNLISQNSIIWQ